MLYKKKYLIGIYGPKEEGETLLGLCDNIKQFAEFMHINYGNAEVILRLLFTHQTRFLRLYGKMCTVEFILDTEAQYA